MRPLGTHFKIDLVNSNGGLIKFVWRVSAPLSIRERVFFSRPSRLLAERRPGKGLPGPTAEASSATFLKTGWRLLSKFKV
jgi:hypothetical protein